MKIREMMEVLKPMGLYGHKLVRRSVYDSGRVQHLVVCPRCGFWVDCSWDVRIIKRKMRRWVDNVVIEERYVPSCNVCIVQSVHDV